MDGKLLEITLQKVAAPWGCRSHTCWASVGGYVGGRGRALAVVGCTGLWAIQLDLAGKFLGLWMAAQAAQMHAMQWRPY